MYVRTYMYVAHSELISDQVQHNYTYYLVPVSTSLSS